MMNDQTRQLLDKVNQMGFNEISKEARAMRESLNGLIAQTEEIETRMRQFRDETIAQMSGRCVVRMGVAITHSLEYHEFGVYEKSQYDQMHIDIVAHLAEKFPDWKPKPGILSYGLYSDRRGYGTFVHLDYLQDEGIEG